uniref:Uncharacterized protein n=1 Tax=Glossina austeni TaxID=7395 RepID=A0A1A9UD34_GLOAU
MNRQVTFGSEIGICTRRQKLLQITLVVGTTYNIPKHNYKATYQCWKRRLQTRMNMCLNLIYSILLAFIFVVYLMVLYINQKPSNHDSPTNFDYKNLGIPHA